MIVPKISAMIQASSAVLMVSTKPDNSRSR